jgi:hypothetical protein
VAAADTAGAANAVGRAGARLLRLRRPASGSRRVVHQVDPQDARRARAGDVQVAQPLALQHGLGRGLRRGAVHDRVRLGHLRAEGHGADLSPAEGGDAGRGGGGGGESDGRELQGAHQPELPKREEEAPRGGAESSHGERASGERRCESSDLFHRATSPVIGEE